MTASEKSQERESEARNKLIKELLTEFEEQGAKPAELPALKKIIELLLEEKEQQLPENLIEKVRAKFAASNARNKTKIFLYRAVAAAVLFLFLASLFLLPNFQNSKPETKIAKDAISEITIKEGDAKAYTLELAANAKKNAELSLEDKPAEISLRSASLLAKTGAKLEFSRDFVLLKKGEFVVKTQDLNLKLKALKFFAEILPDSLMFVEVAYNADNVANTHAQLTVLEGKAKVLFDKSGRYIVSSDNPNKQILYYAQGINPIYLGNESRFNAALVRVNKLVGEFGEDVIRNLSRHIPIRAPKYTPVTVDVFKKAKTGEIELIKTIRLTKDGSTIAVFKILKNDKMQSIGLVAGDKLGEWTLEKINDNGCFFVRDKRKIFVPLAHK